MAYQIGGKGMDIITYVIFFLLIFLLGYASGRRYGHKQGLEEGRKFAPLEMKKDLLRTGKCPICYYGIQNKDD